MRALSLLLIAGCYRAGSIAFDPPDEAESLVLISIVGDRIAEASGFSRESTIPLSLHRDSKLYLLAFDRELEDLGLAQGPLMLAAENDPGRALPEPISWSSGTVKGFGPFVSSELPEDASRLRLASLSIAECWRESGCIAADPFRCRIPCDPARVNPPHPRGRDPIAPEPVDAPKLPAWMPERVEKCLLGSAHFYGGSGCEPIGAECTGRFAADLPPGAIYVESGERIPDDLPIGATLALSTGAHDLTGVMLPESIAIRGACTATEISGLVLPDGASVHDVRLLGGFSLFNASVSLRGVESVGGTITSTGAVSADELVIRGSRVRFVGSLIADRMVAIGLEREGMVVYGTLELRGAVFDGFRRSLVARGAITSSGIARLRGVYVQDAERAGVRLLLDKTEENRIEDLVVRAMRPSPCQPGCVSIPEETVRGGVVINGRATVSRVFVDGAYDRGLLLVAGSSTITDVTVGMVRRGVLPAGSQDSITAIGHGMVLERIEIGHSPGSGIVITGDGTKLYHFRSIEARQYPVLARARGLRMRWIDLPGPSIGSAIVLLGGDIDLQDAKISTATIGIQLLGETSGVRMTGARIEVTGMRFGIALYEGAEAKVSDLRIEDVVIGIGVSRASRFEGKAVRIDARSPVIVLDSHARIEDAWISGTDYMTVGPDDRMIHSSLEIVRSQISNLTSLRSEESATLVLRDVAIRAAETAVDCDGNPAEPSVLEMERVDLDGSMTGLKTDSCAVTATDLRIAGSMTGLFILSEDEPVRIQRFQFEDNDIGARINSEAMLRDGLFLENTTALSAQEEPSLEQVIGVSLIGNAFDLVIAN